MAYWMTKFLGRLNWNTVSGNFYTFHQSQLSALLANLKYQNQHAYKNAESYFLFRKLPWLSLLCWDLVVLCKFGLSGERISQRLTWV